MRTNPIARDLSVSLCLLLLTAMSSPLAAQKTWIVTGPDSTAFRYTMAQVQHGDRVLVRAGSYDAAVIDKGVSVHCDAKVFFRNWGSHGAAGMAVWKLPKNTEFRMVGGVMSTPLSFGTQIQDCAGSVVFEDYSSAGMRLLRSTRVSFNRCRMGQTDVVDSSVSFSECAISGRCTGVVCGALQITNSKLWFSGGSLRGWDKAFLSPAAMGLHLKSGEATIAGDTLITGGADDAPAIHAAFGTLRLAPTVRLQNTKGPLITGAATLIRDHYPSLVTAGVGSGERFSMTTHAEPGSLVWVFASLPVAPQSTPLGGMWISLAAGVTMDMGLVPATGLRQISFVVPSVVGGIPVTMQALTLTTKSHFLFGPPATVITR